ncbi:TetR/AcrR family transcriptional regulator [Streptomyces sp. MBT65]|uniref:TetR/AcrR family transcriptional regulator n=1 Tax=Streptomyces sp. MBT65 TaxID=1488395 RepID=UPI00190B6687|nr:TetR/AcrR family transcriptional regulator [Streptomyces sp. MBT65]MBK3579086.1 TetR/AcrR family transcriptional regulator [Streptomyces sp. MBT65]
MSLADNGTGNGTATGTGTDNGTATGTDNGTRPGAPARGRPRSEAVERAITEGVMKLLEEGVPLAELSIERIARTAGVGKATIYRRWPGKEELFVDVVREAEPQDPELPGISLRDDLVAMMEQLRQRGLLTRSSALLHNVFAQMKSSPKVWAAYHTTVVEPRRRKQVDILRRGQENGELRTDLDPELMNDMLVGPMLLRTVMRADADLPEGLSELLVDTVLVALRPVSPAV